MNATKKIWKKELEKPTSIKITKTIHRITCKCRWTEKNKQRYPRTLAKAIYSFPEFSLKNLSYNPFLKHKTINIVPGYNK